MAGVEEHDDKFQNESVESTSTDDVATVSVSGQESVCTIVPSNNSNEILLYVGDGNGQGVQDLLRVALNQPLGTNPTEIQQQIQDASSKLSLQTIRGDNAHTIISVPVSSIPTNNVDLIHSEEGGITTDHQQEQIPDEHESMTSCEVKKETNNLFHLSSLRDNVDTELEKDQAVVDHVGEVEAVDDMESEVLKAENDALTISDFIIANTVDEKHEQIPGELNIGDSFYCLEDVEEALRLYEEKHGVKLYKRDVRSLEALLKRSLKLQKLDKINERLKYGQLLYCCVYGGKRKAQKMACMDESGYARYTDCKMFIRFAISDDGMRLVVNGKIETHNHDEVVTNEQEPDPQYFTNMGNASGIRLGAGFVDLEELYKAIHKYETDNHVHLWRRDGRTVEALAKRAPGTARKIMETNPGLRFAELRFCCSYGGRQPIDEKKEKKSVNSFKQGCEMHIRFGVSDDGSQLIVKSMSEEHNHEINEETIVKEALHPDLCVYVSKLVWQDIHIAIDDVKAKLEDYVLSVMFKGQTPPPRTRRQYFPSKKQIRYFMTKAKASLNISAEVEEKLEAQMVKLKEAHSNEKIIFNFKVQNDLGNLDDDSMEGDQLNQAVLNANEQNAKVLFCHQSPHQQRLLRRFNSQLILTQICDLHSKIPFPLYCLYVQTNVDYQLVGEFIVQSKDNSMIAEGLQTIKDWNPGWNPKFVVCDFDNEQITAVESVFQGAFVLISDASREQAWSEWLSMESNGVSEYHHDVVKYLDAIALSYSEETLNKAARELEESDVWKMSDKMRNWFQLNWLAQAKRWVAGYRPDDYVMAVHMERTLEDELKMFKSIKLASKSSPLQDVIQQLVEHVVPVAKKQYELLNRESFRLQNELYYMYSDIPNYLSNRPGKLTQHIYDRLKMAATRSYFITEIHAGIFSVQGSDPPDDYLHTISFGDSSSFPSCDCEDWQRYKLPCVHFGAIFNTYQEWTWDMMSMSYRANPIFNVDWSVVSHEFRNETPGQLNDIGTQTTGANLITTCTPDFSFGKIGEPRRAAETPQVLASQCRGLLQQLSKLQLAHHSRDSLYRLRSELKELISIFSVTPKSKVLFPLPALSLSGKSRKQIITSNQSVFEQYNVKLVTPKQVTEAAEAKLRERTEAEVAAAEVESDNEVDAMYISTVNEEQIVEGTTEDNCDDNQTSILTNDQTTSSRKRSQDSKSFFKPLKKKTRQDDDDETTTASGNISINESVQFSHSQSALSSVIDGQTINIPLDQVTVSSSKGIEQILTFTTTADENSGGTNGDSFKTDTTIK